MMPVMSDNNTLPHPLLDAQEQAYLESRALAGLLADLNQLAKEGGIKARLFWPAYELRHPGLWHNLFNLTRYAHGESLCPGLIYPGSSVNWRKLRDMNFDGKALNKLASTQHSKYASDSYGFYFSLYLLGMYKVDRLSVIDLSPLFVYQKEHGHWPETPQKLLEFTEMDRRVRRDLRDRARRLPTGQLGSNNLLILDRLTRTDEFKRALSSAMERFSPRLIYMDARRRNLRRAKLAVQDILHALDEIESIRRHMEKPPGVLVFFDNPIQWLDFQISLRTTFGDKKREWARLLLDQSRVIATPQEDLVQLWHSRALPIAMPPLSTPYVVDARAAQVVQNLHRWAHELGTDDEEVVQELLHAAQVLSHISSLTIPLTNLHEMILSDPALLGIRRYYNWAEAKGRVLGWLRSSSAIEMQDTIDQVLNEGDSLVQHWLENAQPFAQAVANRVLDYCEKGETLLVVGTEVECRYWTELDLDNLSVITSRDPMESLMFRQNRILLTTLSPEQMNQLLCHMEKLQFDWVLTPKSVKLACRHLDGLLAAPGLDVIRPMLEHMRAPLQAGLEEAAIEVLAEVEDRKNPRVATSSDHPNYIPEVYIELSTGEEIGKRLSSEFICMDQHGEPFLITTEDLKVGQSIFVITDEHKARLHELLSEEDQEQLLNAANKLWGVQVYHLALRQAYARLREKDPGFDESTLLRVLHHARPDLEFSWAQIKDWLKPVYEEVHDRPHAPRDWDHYRTLCQSLGIDETMQVNLWDSIKNYRGARIVEGRRQNQMLIRYLLRPEAAAYFGGSQLAIHEFRQELLDSFVTVTSITHAENMDA